MHALLSIKLDDVNPPVIFAIKPYHSSARRLQTMNQLRPIQKFMTKKTRSVIARSFLISKIAYGLPFYLGKKKSNNKQQPAMNGSSEERESVRKYATGGWVAGSFL